MKNLRIEDLSTEQKVGMLLCARSFRTEDDIEFTVELIRNHALGCVRCPFSSRRSWHGSKKLRTIPF